MIDRIQLKQYSSLMRLDKPIGIFLLLWPTLWAVWLSAKGHPEPRILIIFVLGVILMRSAGCIINDFADRRVDGFVARTRERPLVTGKVNVLQAAILFLILISCAFGLVLQLNYLTIELSFIGVFLAILYPFLKRWTHWPQLGLGLAFAWGVPMAFAAELNVLPMRAWSVFFAALVWPVIYDTLYAMVDRQDDIIIGIKSTAILFDRYDRFIVGIFQFLFLCLLVIIGNLFSLKNNYFVSLTGVLLLFIYQQCLIRKRDPQACFKAFLNNHWVGMVIFIGIMLSYLQ